MRYLKPRRFPCWMKINSNVTNTKRYKIVGENIVASFDNNSNLPHCNHIEMSGFYTSSIISYKIDESRELTLYRFCVFPADRIKPNDTRGSLTYAFKGVNVTLNGKKEKINSASFDGILGFNSSLEGLTINRRFIVATDKKALIEQISISNNCGDVELTLKNPRPEKVVKKRYTQNQQPFSLKTKAVSSQVDVSSSKVKISKGETTIYFLYGLDDLSVSQIEEEIIKREKFIVESRNRLQIITPNEQINKMLEFTKLRASESIFKTKNGLMHAPGGGGFYAALWTNDQCEYANPYFACLGYDIANEQSINCYNLYSKFVKSNEVIPTSIVAEGDDIWHGAGDRGDNSMYVYGFARYLLTTGDKALAERYIANLETATEYIISQITTDSIVKSDADELENRFESGKANLCTSTITYDALISLSYLEQELGNKDNANKYLEYAKKIKKGIESYFGATVEGCNTYMYCKEESKLRSWICMPLCVGIYDRKDDTIKALMSDKLRMGNGVLTRSGEKTYWDRSSLYTLKGMFCAGANDEALEFLESYTNERISSEHVPYPVEAFPEGNAAHLSAESALYNRIFTEGVLGYRPTGFNSFEVTPNLPTSWNEMSVSKLHTCGKTIDIVVKNDNGNCTISVTGLNDAIKCKMGNKVVIKL